MELSEFLAKLQKVTKRPMGNIWRYALPMMTTTSACVSLAIMAKSSSVVLLAALLKALPHHLGYKSLTCFVGKSINNPNLSLRMTIPMKLAIF
jgi:hypothetical protein